MKFTCSISIAAPREKVVALFSDFDSKTEWQTGFESEELFKGKDGEKGSQKRLKFINRGKPMQLIETVLLNDLPNEFVGLYEHKHMTNSMKSVFKDLPDGRCGYSAYVEYTRFSGFFPRLLAKMFPEMFKRQVENWMDNLKQLAEMETT